MYIRHGVRIIGATYLALAIIGFLPLDVVNPIHHTGLGAHYLLNLVAINTLHNLIHLTLGLTGLWASHTLERAQWWGRIAGSVLLLVFVLGMAQAVVEGLPVDQSLLGVVLNSPGHILHLTTGGLALYLGLAPLAQATPAAESPA